MSAFLGANGGGFMGGSSYMYGGGGMNPLYSGGMGGGGYGYGMNNQMG